MNEVLAETNPSLFSTHIQRKRIATLSYVKFAIVNDLFNPYPAKADCDIPDTSPQISDTLPFQPISSESGLRPSACCAACIVFALFNPYPAKADCDQLHKGRRLPLCSFQPISSESGLRPATFVSCKHLGELFNPYPAKADCDGEIITFQNDSTNAFQPISSESGLRLSVFGESSVNVAAILPFQPISSESGLRQNSTSSYISSHHFSTHIQRKRIATLPVNVGAHPRASFQPISSESGLRPGKVVWLFRM